MDIARSVAAELLKIRAVQLQPTAPFTWASGLRAPIYCDNRIILSHPPARQLITDAFRALATHYQPVDGVAGVATAGIAHGALLAQALDLPFIYVRSKAKGHGRQNQIEGALQTNGRYLVVEDLISTGGSSLAAVEALRAASAEVAAVVAIFTYGFSKATQAFKEADCPLATLTDYDSLLSEAQRTGYIPEDALTLLRAWRSDPVAWSEQQG